MTAIDHSAFTEKSGIRNWLGFGRASGPDLSGLPALAAHLRASAPGSRADVVASIAEFLEQFDLDVCPYTLAAAHDYVSGEDPLLVRLIDERAMIGQAITVDWLRKLRGQSQGDQEATELHRTFEKLEKHLIEFGATATAARKATQAYGFSLEGHVEQLNNAQEVSGSVTEILSLVRGMIDKTVDMEKEMARSERHSETLRRNLEAALRSSEQDFLTGLPNRRAFEKTFEVEYREARAAMDHLVVAFCDIDHFKRINDNHGHETGDRVLKAVARNLSGISSDRCHIARHGGEEFVVLFRGKSLDEAKDLLDAARIELSERHFVNRQTKTPIGHVTFSAGIADVFAYPDRRAALKAADSALYMAKGNGRNQILAA